MRTYLKAFLFLALTASIACAGANFAQATETGSCRLRPGTA